MFGLQLRDGEECRQSLDLGDQAALVGAHDLDRNRAAGIAGIAQGVPDDLVGRLGDRQLDIAVIGFQVDNFDRKRIAFL